MNAKITNADFAAAKKAVKAAVKKANVGGFDPSFAFRIAKETLAARCLRADEVLIADMAWQVVLCAR